MLFFVQKMSKIENFEVGQLFSKKKFVLQKIYVKTFSKKFFGKSWPYPARTYGVKLNSWKLVKIRSKFGHNWDFLKLGNFFSKKKSVLQSNYIKTFPKPFFGNNRLYAAKTYGVKPKCHFWATFFVQALVKFFEIEQLVSINLRKSSKALRGPCKAKLVYYTG